MTTSPSTPHSLLGLAQPSTSSGSTSSPALRTRVTVGSASVSSHAQGVLGGSSSGAATSSTSLMSGVAGTASSLGGLFSSAAAATGSTTPTSSTPANVVTAQAGQAGMNPPSALLAAQRGLPLAPSLTTAQGAHAHTRPSASTSTSAFGSVGSRSSARAQGGAGPGRQQQQQHHQQQQTNTYLDRGDAKVEVLPCFREDAENRGNVLVIVSGVEFWVHKDILFFASPFFRALLEGDWKESHPSLHSRSDSSHSSSRSISDLEDEEDIADAITPVSDAAVMSCDGERHTPPTTLAQLRVSNDEADVAAMPAPDGTEASVAPSSDEALDLATKRLSGASPRASFHSALHTLDTAPSSPTFPASSQGSTAHLRRRSASEGGGSRSSVVPPLTLTLQTSSASTHEAPARADSTPQVPLARRLHKLATPPVSPRHSSVDPAFDTAPSSRTYEPTRSASAPKLFSSKQQHQRAVPFATAGESSSVAPLESSAERRRRRAERRKARDSAVAVVKLPEEDAGTFQDVLCHVYPHLELCVTWYNIAGLMRFTDKYSVPFLRRSCTSWLRVALAGRPIEAMALGEQHGLEDVYKDASRSVLDNMTSWEPEELAILSGETLLKLERKRTWFLERLLKLGLANPARDYECCAACPDPAFCSRSLQERWQAAYAASFRFGPPQPSVIWRHLRELEGSGAGQPLAACHKTSQAWVQSLFDRMFTTALSTPPKFLSIKLNDPPRPPFGRAQ